MTEKYQWDLTEDETTQLGERWKARMGRVKLLEALERLFGSEIEGEAAWWEAVSLRLGIPSKYASVLAADHRLGKIWVRGKVKKFDKKESKDRIDNPIV